MLTKEKILELLNTIPEHRMAKEIYVPVLKAMGMKGVKFTGGPDEEGIDIEYYELTQPENHRSYVGIQFKKNDLVYGSGGSKNTVKEVENQAAEAFIKDIVDIDNHSIVHISRFIVAVTGVINEPARRCIGRARQQARDRRIDYWDGDRLAEYIQNNWMEEFEKYFKIDPEEDDSIEIEESIIDDKYIEDNYSKLLKECLRVRKILSKPEWSIIQAIIKIGVFESDNLRKATSAPIADIFIELERPEDFFSEELRHLTQLDFIEHDEGELYINGKADVFSDLAKKIVDELTQADEDLDNAETIFDDLLT